ncbi:MOSC domain-containing protein [Halomarina ordinaria]|uniref:MOSC domain-containing protein n=1 Tax=Halomarina ordinaria TaxID=3033939 RepID=A0ABD5U443_9EURY|nr:MOSC N-terminal beta barrel domain-containing protein [Halomarina sp. PSRA2]
MAELRRITTYPVKSLDPRSSTTARLDGRGALAGDREYAMVAAPPDAPHDPESASVGGRGDYVNGKRTPRVHRLRSSVDRSAGTLTLREHGRDETHAFDLDDRTALDSWLSDYFGEPVSVRREPTGGFPDDRQFSGPTVVSTATLREVGSWFDLPTDDVRRRFRANLEVGDVPAFWEDRLYADHGEAVAFRIGDAELLGVNPCQRCVVPSRDPDTGEAVSGFRERFIERRAATRPDWLDSDRFDHDFRLMVNTHVPASTRGATLRVGDEVAVLGTRSLDGAGSRHARG